MESNTPNPTDIPAPGSYRWTPALQREFLTHLAINGSVKIAAAMVYMSPSAAYQLQQRPEGAAFRLGWAAAILIARGRLADELLDRAIWGVEETSERDANDHHHYTKRRRHIPSLGLAMLARLDKMVETRARAGEAMLAQIIAGDWPGFLSLFDIDADNPDAEGHGAALACWLAARDSRANPLATLWKDTPIANEVAQFSGDPDAEPEADPTPEEEAAAMTMWRDYESRQWRTNFPPPEDYVGLEEGEFGDAHYSRTLDVDEEVAFEARRTAAFAPLRQAGEAARRAFFGLHVAANDRNDCEGESSRGDAETRSEEKERRQAP